MQALGTFTQDGMGCYELLRRMSIPCLISDQFRLSSADIPSTARSQHPNNAETGESSAGTKLSTPQVENIEQSVCDVPPLERGCRSRDIIDLETLSETPPAVGKFWILSMANENYVVNIGGFAFKPPFRDRERRDRFGSLRGLSKRSPCMTDAN